MISFHGLSLVEKAAPSRWHDVAGPLIRRVATHRQRLMASVSRAVMSASRAPLPAIGAHDTTAEIRAKILAAIPPWPVDEWASILTAMSHETAAHALSHTESVRKSCVPAPVRKARKATAGRPFTAPEGAYDRAATIARRQAGALAEGLTKEQTAVVRRLVADAVQGKATGRQVRNGLIARNLGNNEKGTQAVLHLRDTLVESGMDDDAVERKCAAYADRLVRSRADTIARTETMRAINQGTEAGWRETAARGFMPEGAKRVWIVGPHPCDVCADMEDEETELDEPWIGPDGEEFDTPQDAHPNCECTEGLVFHDVGETWDSKPEWDEPDQEYFPESAAEGYDRVGKSWLGRVTKRLLAFFKEFDEAKVNRDERGRFSEGGGGGASEKPKQMTLPLHPPKGTLLTESGTPLEVFHGSVDPDLTHPDPAFGIENAGATFFTDNEDVAWQYTFEREYGESVGESSENVVHANLVMHNPLEVDMHGRVGDATVLNRHLEEARAKGHDGVIFRNIDDTVDSSRQMGTTYAVFNRSQILPVRTVTKAEHDAQIQKEFDESKITRDERGRFSEGGGGGESKDKPAGRAERAKATHKVASKEKQRLGEHNEGFVAKAVGGKGLEDNEPMDVVVKTADAVVGVEVKTFCDNSNDKVTMHPDSLQRKTEWEREGNRRTCTVVIDDRGTFGGGSFLHLYSGTRLWFRQGVGSFRLKSMTPVKSLAHLRRLIRGK